MKKKKPSLLEALFADDPKLLKLAKKTEARMKKKKGKKK